MTDKTNSTSPSGKWVRSKQQKWRVELHLHLDGSVRLRTIAELAKAKQWFITGSNTEAELGAVIMVDKPSNLSYFLSKLNLYLPLLVGDLQAIERISYELCQDQAAEQVLYFETRYSPHLLANTVKHFFVAEPVSSASVAAVTPRDVVKAVARGLRRGEADFGLIGRAILCTIKGFSGWSTEVVRLAAEMAAEGVVGVDIAGEEGAYSQEETDAFRWAKQHSVHRTVHAGEMGPASNVAYAVQQMHAERIGHGYRVLQDQTVYRMCRDKNIHFETCPYSSYLTGAVSPTECKHPIVTFAEDSVNFSINKDDSTLTKHTLEQECQLAQQKGLDQLDLNVNSARSCFLPEHEKQALLNRLLKLYGFIE